VLRSGADARVPARTLLRLEEGAVDEDAVVDVDIAIDVTTAEEVLAG